MKQFNIVMKTLSLITALCFSTTIFGQSPIYTVTTSPAILKDCQAMSVNVTGNKYGGNITVLSSNAVVSGSTIDVTIDFSNPLIITPVISQFNQTVGIGMVPAGSYTLNVITTQGGVVQATNSSMITVTSCCAVSTSIGTTANYLCLGDSVTLTSTSMGATTYNWSQNGTTVSTGSSLMFVPTSAGTYDFLLQGGNGSCTTADSVTIIVDTIPTVDLGADLTGCAGQPLTLDATNSNPNATYDWGNGNTNAMLSPTNSGNYTVTVSLNACSATDDINVTYNPTPSLSLGGNTSACQGQTVNLDGTVVEMGTIYTWNDGSTTPTLAVTNSGTYTLTATLGNCSAVDSAVVTFNNYPTVNLGPDVAICKDASLTLNTMMTGGSYLWNDGSTMGTFTVDSAGMYWVQVTVNGCAASDTLMITTAPDPVVDLGADSAVICFGGSYVIDATTTGVTYLWNDNSTNATLTATTGGDYSVQVTSSQGCTATDNIHLTVGNEIVIGLADSLLFGGNDTTLDAGVWVSYLWSNGATTQTITVNGAGTYSVTVTDANGCTGTESVVVQSVSTMRLNQSTDLKVFPNPAIDYIALKNSDVVSKTAHIVIRNELGQVVKSTILNTNLKIDVSELSSGVYYITLLDKENLKVGVGKFLKL